MSKDGIYFQCINLKFLVLQDEVFFIYCAKYHESRLCEHSNVVKFEKRAAKTPQHGHRYGNIIMLYDTINTYECFFCYNWHELCSSSKLLDFSTIYSFLVKYAIKYQTWMSSYPTICYADLQQAVPSNSGAGTSSYWVMPSYTAISTFSFYFEVRPRQNWFISRFRWPCSLWCFTDSCRQSSFITLWIFVCISAYLWIYHRIFLTLLTLDNYIYQTHEWKITKFYLLVPKYPLIQLTK